MTHPIDAAFIARKTAESHEGFTLSQFFHEELYEAITEGTPDPITPEMATHAKRCGYQRSEWATAPPGLALPKGMSEASKTRVALLCPGPSLRRSWPSSGGYLATIAVNRAIHAVGGADWLASWDVDTVKAYADSARVGVLTNSKNVGHVDGSKARITEAMMPHAVKHLASSFSKLGALVLAAWLGAEEIHIFGDDMQGETYCDGEPVSRGDVARWTREATLGSGVAKWMQKVRGIPCSKVLSVAGSTP